MLIFSLRPGLGWEGLLWENYVQQHRSNQQTCFVKKGVLLHKPFEALQRSVKIKFYVNFFSSSEIGTGRVNMSMFS